MQDYLVLTEEKAANIMRQLPNRILIPGISPRIRAAKAIPYTGSRQVVTLTVDAVILLRDETKRVCATPVKITPSRTKRMISLPTGI